MVRRNLEEAVRIQARQYNLRRRTSIIQLGDLVLLKQRQLSNAANNFAAKMAPYTVEKFIFPIIVSLKDDSNRLKTANIYNVKSYTNFFPFQTSGEVQKNQDCIPDQAIPTALCPTSDRSDKTGVKTPGRPTSPRNGNTDRLATIKLGNLPRR